MFAALISRSSALHFVDICSGVVHNLIKELIGTLRIILIRKRMPPQLLKKQCFRCNKTFYVYDNRICYCNADCKNKDAYYTKLGLTDPLDKRAVKNHCEICQEAIYHKKKQFCSIPCEKEAKRRASIVKSNSTETKRLVGKTVSYDELNRRSERKRVFGKGSEVSLWLTRDLI